MKFRGMMNDVGAMADFSNTVMSLSKIAKDSVMRITSNKLYFIVCEEDCGPRKPLVWCELPSNYYFKEYNLVGISDEHNEIYLEFCTALLAKSLTTSKQNTRCLKIKLTHKQTPCLTLEIELVSSDGIQNRQCVHDIPVDVISQKHWENYSEPQFTDFHVTIQMPNLKTVKNIVERMKNLSHTLTVCANKDGRLALRIKTNMISLAVHFTELSVKSFAVGHIPTLSSLDNEGDCVSSTIDIKKFLMFLSGLQISNYNTTCSIVQESMVKLYMEQPGALSIQIFLSQMSA